jgi:hypothetical protein
MEKYYLVEVIEPNKKLKNENLWKQKCNFYIEVLKITTYDEHKKGKKENTDVDISAQQDAKHYPYYYCLIIYYFFQFQVIVIQI